MNNFWKRLLFVRKCIVCKRALPDAGEDTVFCADCLREYRKLCHDDCPRCGMVERECRCVPRKLMGRVGFAAHLFSYHGDIARRILYTLKQENLPFLQRFLAGELSALVREVAQGDLSGFSVTYAPRKPKSIRIYGFDQAEILARLLAEELHLPFCDLFTHARFSKLQKSLSARMREKNAARSYSLREDFVRTTGRLLIFDDVMTTGSTLSSLVSLAKMAGFREVCVVCLAKTIRL